MSVSRQAAEGILKRLQEGRDDAQVRRQIARRMPADMPLPPRLPAGNDLTPVGVRRRLDVLSAAGIRCEALAGDDTKDAAADLQGNIESFIGFARIPVGVIGPLRINGAYANGDFYVPMATTEGALVASYQRGAFAVSQSGGASVLCLSEVVYRAPCFVFASLSDAGTFAAWALSCFAEFQDIARQTSRHCTLKDLRTSLTGKELFLVFEFETGDAAGQNMITVATDAICRHAVARASTKPATWVLEANMSGDKKASMAAFLHARGKKVVAEATLDRHLLRRILHVDAETMHRFWQLSMMGAVQSGTIGVQGHCANALAALFIACGQDAACVAEASVGLTRVDVVNNGDLYMSVSLPNLIVGTVGGGTHLPTARECLAMVGCSGSGTSRKFAEICAATVLAGEISIGAALAAGDFAAAHARHRHKAAPAAHA